MFHFLFKEKFMKVPPFAPKKINRVRQAGMTLIEVIASLAVVGVVVVGALSLYANANSSQSSTQTLKDLIAIRSAVQQLYLGQGSYGVGNLNAPLITANKIPSTLTVSGSTLTTPFGGTLTATGATTAITLALTNVPADICTSLLTNASQGWASVKVGASAALTTFPVTPTIATAAAQCGGTAPFTITWTTLN